MDFLPPATKKLSSLSPVKSGLGLGIDLGAIYKQSRDLRLGLVIHNLGTLSF